MFDTPHLKVPISFGLSGLALVEQDSPAEVEQNVYAVLAYEQGQRPELPEFGRPDTDLLLGGVNLAEIRGVIERWEPRAAYIAERLDPLLTDAVDTLTIELRDQNG